MYKPKGWTSFDVVKKVRNITQEKKVGHAGTLDPFAEGVLVLGTGKDTKILQNISNTEKWYEAVLKLGHATNTMDIEGEISESKQIPNLDTTTILKTLQSFLGEQKQVPPMFSAKKINGIRLYKLARKNIDVKREPSKINIKSMELIRYDNPLLTFRVLCSKGTYIRVLGSEIAEKLGTVGHLTELIRLGVGDYTIDDTIKVSALEEQWKS